MDVSILIPVYNGEKYVQYCIDSCLKQIFKGTYEIIVVNDGSTDSTSKILHSYKDDRLKIFDNEHCGIVDSLNFGISQCSGKYIARMDADDVMVPLRLEKQFDFFEHHPEYTVVCGKVIRLYSDGHKEVNQYKSGDITFSDVLRKCCIYHPTVMFKNDCSVSYTHDNEWAEDYSLWLDLLKKGKKIYKMDFPLIAYRVHEEQVTKVFNKESVYQNYSLKLKYGYFNLENKLDDVIVSLTSHAERVPFLYRIFESIYQGSVVPNKVFLTLNDEDVPRIGLRTQWFIDKGLVELNVTEKRYRPHLKYYDAFKRYGNENVVVTIDDDYLVTEHWLESLYASYTKHRKCVSAMCVALPTFDSDGTPKSKNQWKFNLTDIQIPAYSLIAEGVGGVLYPPEIITLPDDIEQQIFDFITEDDLLLKKLEMEQDVKVVVSIDHIRKRQRQTPIKEIRGMKNGLIHTNIIDNSIEYIKKIPQEIWDKIRLKQD